jgi:tetratricopeptide (TPR) repeat protein
MKLRCLVVVLCGCLFVSSSPVEAAGNNTADATAKAREHFVKGTAHYDLGRYREAALEYEAAYEAKNEPSLLFNIGQAYRLAGDLPNALRAYKSFVRRVPDSPLRAEVEGQIAKINALIEEQSRVKTSPPTGTIQPEPRSNEPTPKRPSNIPKSDDLVVQRSAPSPRATPVYKKWWLWTTIGGVVALGVGLGVGLALSLPNNPPRPAGAVVLEF